MSHVAVKSFDRRVSCKNARTVQFSGGVEKCPVTQKTALPLVNCSRLELQLNRKHGHRWSRVRCEEHRAWPTTTSVDAAGNQRCSPAHIGRVTIPSTHADHPTLVKALKHYGIHHIALINKLILSLPQHWSGRAAV